MSFSVFRMLDTHRRRLLRRLGWEGTLSFDIDAAWGRENGAVAIGHAEASSPPIKVGRPPELQPA